MIYGKTEPFKIGGSRVVRRDVVFGDELENDWVFRTDFLQSLHR